MKKAMLLIVCILVISSSTLCYMTIKVRQINDRADALQQQTDKLKLQLEQYVDIPDWLLAANVKCSSSEVPQAFYKDCLYYEVKRH